MRITKGFLATTMRQLALGAALKDLTLKVGETKNVGDVKARQRGEE